MIKKINILGFEYSVEESNFVEKEKEQDLTGEVWNTHTKININSASKSEDHKLGTLFHEIIEALNYRLEWKLSHQLVTQLESSLFQVLKCNPKFVKMFLKDENE